MDYFSKYITKVSVYNINMLNVAQYIFYDIRYIVHSWLFIRPYLSVFWHIATLRGGYVYYHLTTTNLICIMLNFHFTNTRLTNTNIVTAGFWCIPRYKPICFIHSLLLYIYYTPSSPSFVIFAFLLFLYQSILFINICLILKIEHK